MKSVMVHDFSRIPQTDCNRSTFDRSHGVKTAFDSGYLVPIECQEVLPGDAVSFDLNLLARLPACVTPPMDNVFLDTQAFFVPSRLIWNNFTKMMGERVNPRDSIDYLVPQINSGTNGFAVGSLADYLGIPTNVPNLSVNALPFRAVAKIWDDWYRDENLQDSIIQEHDDLGDGNPRNINWNTLLKRGKRHDYFTSCLPTPQRGDGVEISIAGEAPVYGTIWSDNFSKSRTASALQFEAADIQHTTNRAVYTAKNTLDSSGTINIQGDQVNSSKLGAVHPLRIANDNFGEPNPFALADLSAASAVTINSLRMAFQLQRFLERENRSGSRYIEIIRGFFNTICPDARLQRSEYLGGSSQQISFTPIAQTSESGETPQGNLASQGKCFSKSRFAKAFTEHGYLIIFANVRCDLNYQQGLNRMWSRRTRYDFFWPTLQNLGEQAVLNKEIFAQGANVKDSRNNPVDDGVFGYQERYAEYRYNPSIITGRMRSTAPQSLDVWHLAQRFDALPTLSKEFIEDTPPLRRILAVQDEPEIILDAYISQKWTRPMSTYSIPGLIDHM